MAKKRSQRSRRRARRWRLPLTLGVLVLGVAGMALAAFLIVGGGRPGAPEEMGSPVASPVAAEEAFRAFPNRTGYPDSAVWEAYRYAAANPEVLGYIPCFCGCVHHGDTSNLECYIDERKPDGSVRYDPHAAG